GLCRIALEDDEFAERTRVINKKARESFEQLLQLINRDYYESNTNLLLVNTSDDADELREYIIRHVYIVHSGIFLIYTNTDRITNGTAKEMTGLQNVLTKFEQEHK